MKIILRRHAKYIFVDEDNVLPDSGNYVLDYHLGVSENPAEVEQDGDDLIIHQYLPPMKYERSKYEDSPQWGLSNPLKALAKLQSDGWRKSRT